VVLVAAPPPARRPRPQHLTLPNAAELYRIYDPTRHGAGPLSFRRVGPLVRFDHHESGSSERAIYYAALTLDACVVEVFGDVGVVRLDELRVANPLLERELLLLDLRGRAAMRAGTVVAVATADHALSQQWSRYFYDNPDTYGQIDGLVYANAHNGADAIAIYERAQDAFVFPPDRDRPLREPVIETAIRAIARANNLLVE
jgi:hypothetical protein